MLIIALVLVPMGAVAQEDPVQRFDVPESGYQGEAVLAAGSEWNEYSVTVPKNHELVFTFQVQGQGDISVYLVPDDNPTNIRYYTTRPVSEYSARVPAIIGFDTDYTILVNTSYPGDVHYTASIHTIEEAHPEYLAYYALIALGFVALVILSYKFVVWQEKREKQKKKEAAKKRRGKRGN